MNEPNSDRSRRRRIRWGIGLAAVAAAAAAIFAAAVPASADPSPSPSGSAGAATGEQPPQGRTGGHNGETVLTGSQAEKATAAALKAVPGATINRVETDADGAVYEAHLTRADGTKATVKFDKDFNVTSIEEGMGAIK